MHLQNKIAFSQLNINCLHSSSFLFYNKYVSLKKENMIDKITSLLDNYNGKIKNPFIGTIISVWLIHNWRIPYAIFNFEKECSLQDKINFIADYFGKQNFWSEIIDVIGYSFLILLLTFLLMAISRMITDSFYKILEPYIMTTIDKKAIYTIKEKNKLERRITNLNIKISDKDSEIHNLEQENNRINKERTETVNKLSEEITSKNDLILSLEENLKTLNSRLEPFNSIKLEFDQVFNKISNVTVNTLKSITSEKSSFKLELVIDSFLLTSKGLIYDPNGNAKIIDGSYDTDLFLNTTFELTSLGRLFVGYLKEQTEW